MRHLEAEVPALQDQRLALPTVCIAEEWLAVYYPIPHGIRLVLCSVAALPLVTYPFAVHHSKPLIWSATPNPLDLGLGAVGTGLGSEAGTLYNRLCGAFRAGRALGGGSVAYSWGTFRETRGQLARLVVTVR